MPDGILQRIRQMTEDPVADSDPVAPQLRLPLTVLLLAIGAGGAVDLVLDAPEDWRSFHVLYEVALILGALGLVAWLWRGWWRAEASETGSIRPAPVVTSRKSTRAP